MPVSEEQLEKLCFELIRNAAIYIPGDTRDALKTALANESSSAARSQMEAMLKNCDLAASEKLSICQDTGLPIFFITMSPKVNIEGDIQAALERAVSRATTEIPMRQNVIHPLTLKNSGTNTGWMMPYPHLSWNPDADYVEITAVPKGFGAEIRSSITWILTSEDVSKGVIKAVLDLVEDSKGEPCPPNIICVGVGGTSEVAMLNAKRAMFRTPLGRHNPDPAARELEEKLLKAINDTKLGAMAVGGDTLAFAVHIELAGSHTAVVPVGIIFECWAHRYSTARVYSDGRIEYVTHPKEA